MQPQVEKFMMTPFIRNTNNCEQTFLKLGDIKKKEKKHGDIKKIRYQQ
jgi:hypothetical protein